MAHAPNPVEIRMDAETVRLIAEAAAQKAADTVRERLKEDFEQVEHKVVERLNTFFGDTSPTHHIVQHARIDKLLNFVDGLSSNIIGTIVKNAMLGLGVMALIGYVIWTKFVG